MQFSCTTSESVCTDKALSTLSWPRIMPHKDWEEVWHSTPIKSQTVSTTLSTGRLDLTSYSYHSIDVNWGLYQRPALSF